MIPPIITPKEESVKKILELEFMDNKTPKPELRKFKDENISNKNVDQLK